MYVGIVITFARVDGPSKPDRDASVQFADLCRLIWDEDNPVSLRQAFEDVDRVVWNGIGGYIQRRDRIFARKALAADLARDNGRYVLVLDRSSHNGIYQVGESQKT